MNNKSPLDNKRPLLITLVILLTFTFFLSKILLIGQSFLQSSVSPPSWLQQQWLEYPGGSEVLYLRKNFNLATQPDWAFLSVSAIDEFIVYLNGQSIGGKYVPGEAPAEVYDVTPILQIGKNTLAIRSASQQKHINAQAIAKLNWRALGENLTLSTNHSWRAEHKELSQRHGLIAWFQNDYKDDLWANTTSNVNSPFMLTNSLFISSTELQKLQPANWIWVNHLDFRRINISKTFTLNTHNISNAWLAISTEGSYQLSINGLVFPTRSMQQEKMEYFTIAPYLKKGKNMITVQFQSAENRLDKIALSGLITTKDTQLDYSLSPKWNCENIPCRSASVSPGQVRPTLKAVVLTEPLKYTLLQGYKQFKWFIFIFITCLIFIQQYKLIR